MRERERERERDKVRDINYKSTAATIKLLGRVIKARWQYL